MSKDQVLDLLAGFLFGIGFGMIIGYIYCEKN